MTEEELDRLGAALDEFLQPYFYCCGYTQTFGHLHTYCRGLLSDLKRRVSSRSPWPPAVPSAPCRNSCVTTSGNIPRSASNSNATLGPNWLACRTTAWATSG